ncbi:unnamed protein product [Moneuplotes crassus]|uniref:Uncharacterized protein n=1 Tax=Euplotes crassus TaxID=5936 RepID=A0AAD1UFM5_EUPCR|nr:unnamed protein product [Moneuplotes crassus]
MGDEICAWLGVEKFVTLQLNCGLVNTSNWPIEPKSYKKLTQIGTIPLSTNHIKNSTSQIIFQIYDISEIRGRRIKLLLFLLVIKGLYGCAENYYEVDSACMPCHSSCKSCTQGDRCDTCEEFMMLKGSEDLRFLSGLGIKEHYRQTSSINTTSLLCTHCEDDQYYDETLHICRSCEGACSGKCKFRTQCITCDPGKTLDLDTLTCVDDCNSSQIKLEGFHLSVKSACRTPDYYIDPFSQEILELGTLQYPYRTMKSASSEILTFLSHKQVNVTINVKDVYIEDRSLFIMNITEITFQSHPELLEKRKAVIIPTQLPQIGISQKARFHLLQSVQMPVLEVLGAGAFSYKEQIQIGSRISNMVARSAIKFESVDFYREEIDYNKDILFMLGVYLQDKTATFSNMMINVTGTFWTTQDPFNLYIRNIVFDTYSLRNILGFSIECNYPEAYKSPTIDIDGLRFITSRDRTTGSNPNGIATNHAGSITIKNLDVEDYYSTLSSISASFFYTVQATCTPDDGLIQTGTFENFSISVKNDRGDKINPIALDISNIHYRSIVSTFENIEFFGYQRTMFTPALFTGTPLDILNINSLSMKDSFFFSDAIKISFFQKVTFGSLASQSTVFENIGAFTDYFLVLFYVGQVEISNFKFQNVTGPFSRSLSFIYLNNMHSTPTKIENIQVSYYNFWNGGLISVISSLERIEIQNITISDSNTNSKIPIIEATSLKSFFVSDFHIKNVNVNDQNDEDSTILRVNAIDLQTTLNSTLENINFINSQLSLIQFGSLVNSNSDPIQLEMKNISVIDSTFPSSRSIISTKNLENDADFLLKISGFHSSNVTFKNNGNLLLFSHGLHNPVVIEDSIFSTLYSAAISASSSGLAGTLTNEVTFQNCTFKDIQSSSQSLIKVSEKAIANFVGSSFSSISVSFDRAGVIETSSNSIAKFSYCNFTDNAAVTSTLFTISSGAYLECNSCLITNNFGVTNGVVSVSSNGYFKFYGSDIFGNIAIQTPIGQIFDASQTSIFDNCKIHNNSIMTSQEFEREATESCSKLCFVSPNVLQNMYTYNLYNLPSQFYLLEIISGSLEISNQTQIYEESEILNLYMTTCVIVESFIRNIKFLKTPFKVTTSTLELHDVSLSNVLDISSREIFLVNDESKFIITNTTYEDSNSMLVNSLSGEIQIVNFKARNISNFPTFAKVYSLKSVLMKNLTFDTLIAMSEEVIKIEESNNISIDSFTTVGLNATVISIMNSVIESINNIKISDSLKAISVVDSHIKKFENSSFTNNGIQDNFISGGAISMFNSDLTVRNTTFSNNTADKAGAIAFECDSTDRCILVLENTTFSNNSASVQGGAIHYSLKRPDIVDSVFTGNSARYGDDLASYPVKVRIKEQPFSFMKFTNIGSGVSLSQPIELALFDFDNQIISLNNEDQLGIFPLINPNDKNHTNTIRGVSTVNFNAGIAIVDEIIFIDQPGSKNVIFKALTTAIDQAKASLAFPDQDFNNDITVDFRFCQPGEEVTDQRTCRECDAGTYSLKWNSTECTKCMDNALCLGSNQISVNPGFWRSSQTSEFITECLVEESCEGGFTNSTLNPVNCAEGYQGELCSHCLVNEMVKYRKVSNVKCDKCPAMITNTILVAGLALLTFIFMMALIIINIRKTKESQLSILLRIMTNYFQLIFTSLSLTTNYPTSLMSFFEIPKMFGDASDTFLSVDCFIRDYDIEYPFGSNAIFKLFLLILLPLILFSLVALIWIAVHFVKRKYVKDLKRNLVISFISVLFLLHPKLTEQSLGLFRCIDVNVDDSRVRMDISIKCYSSEHIKWLLLISLPCIIVWVVSLPLAALVVLFYNFKKQEDNKFKQYFLILYQGLKKDKFYWEFVNTARKILILMIFPLPTEMKMLIAILLLAVLARIQITLQPYKNTENNKIEILATSAGIITIFSGLLYSQPDEMKVLNTVSLIFCCFINIYFILCWFLLLSQSFQNSSQLFQILSRLLSFSLCKWRTSNKEICEKHSAKPENQQKKSKMEVYKKRIHFNSKKGRKGNKQKSRALFTKRKRQRDFENIKENTTSARIMPRNPSIPNKPPNLDLQKISSNDLKML